VDVTAPDGSEETLGPFTSDPVGGGYTWYTPTQVGIYTLVSKFLGQKITGIPGREDNINVNDTFAPSTSRPTTFTVQQDPIPTYEETPLPTDRYWTRPIYDANRGWGDTVMGQWLGGNYYEELREDGIPNTSAPESSHILWARSYWSGGIMGGHGDVAYYNGIAYEGLASPKLVLEGKAYYPVETPPRYGWYCIDIYTGEIIYYENNTDGTKDIPEFGEVLNIQNPNQFGGFPYLWRTSGVGANTWEMLDGFSGKAICRIENVPSWTASSFFRPGGYQFHDAIGGVCYLNFVNLGTNNAPDYYLQIWNTTEAIWWKPTFGVSPPKTLINGTTNLPITTTSNDYWTWRPETQDVYDGNNGYSMNVSVESTNGGSIQEVKLGEYVIVGSGGLNDATGITEGFLKAYSLKRPNWGDVLWEISVTPPQAAPVEASFFGPGGPSFGNVDSESGVFSYTERVTGKIWVHSLETGELLWQHTISSPWYYYGTSITFHSGKAYTISTTGVVNCFNATTGEFYWNWTAPEIGYLETEGLQYTPVSLAFFVDDPLTGREKLYLHGSTGWAGQTSPIRRDGSIFCLDTNSGEMLWRLMAYPCYANNGLSRVILSEGRIIYMDNHDNQIYCLGKGPSATTVTVSPKISVHGDSFMIEGTVTDQTDSGRYNVAGSLDFSLKGTPAISDESMSEWMEYLFHQRPKPKDAEGVEVVITTVDPNGNSYELGRTTSDINGNFGCIVDPPVPGKYQIIATFEGSESYFASTASTYLSVKEASSPAQALEPEAPEEPAEEPAAPEEPTEPEPSEPEPEAPTEPDQPEEPTEPEPTEPTAEAPLFSTTDLAIIAAVAVAAVIGVVAYWQLRKRK
jgi:hypothetical protein